jgi:glycosyltransferase involved in cell wall biosynthesis
MKKIVIDARGLRTSSGRYVERLVEYLQEVDTDLSHRYVILLKPKDMDTWEPKSKRFNKVACRYKDFGFGEQFGLAWQLYKLKPDLVHFPMAQQPVLYQKAVVTTIQDLTTLRFYNEAKNRYVFKLKQRVYKLVVRYVALKSRALIAFSEYARDDIARFTRTNSSKFTVTLLAGDQVSEPAVEMPEVVGKRFLLYVGRPMSHKNLSRLIDAFAQLRIKHPDLYLVLAGKRDANYKRHAKEVRQKGVEQVIFTGFIPDGQLRWLYEHCDAYVFPSLSEGFGLPGLEAMANGAPVVSSNTTSLPEVHGDAAQYFDPENVDDMVKAINAVITKPELRKQLIAAGKKQVAKFSWQRMAEQTLEVYKQVLKEN